MNQKMLVLACTSLVTLAIAGCKPQPLAEPVAAITPAASATTTATAPIAASSTAPALDQKGFAGTFASDTSAIALNADGTFDLKEVQAEFDGTWTAEADGAQIRLDPNSKAEPDRLYAVAGKDQIRPLDADGQPIDGAPGLQRERSAD